MNQVNDSGKTEEMMQVSRNHTQILRGRLTLKVPDLLQFLHFYIGCNFFPSHAILRRRRKIKKALIRVRNRRDFGNGV